MPGPLRPSLSCLFWRTRRPCWAWIPGAYTVTRATATDDASDMALLCFQLLLRGEGARS